MNRKIYLKILVGAGAALLSILLLPPIIITHWVKNKLELTFNSDSSNYIITAEKVKPLMIQSGIELQRVRIQSKNKSRTNDLDVEIKSFKITGISLVNAIFKKEAKIRKITISDGNISGKIPSNRDSVNPVAIPFDLRVRKVSFDRIDLTVLNSADAGSFSFKGGSLRFYAVHVEKNDTLSTVRLKPFDFEAQEIVSVTSDSMYLYRNTGISFSTITNILEIDSIFVKPTYKDYDFTSRYEFQKNRIEAGLSKIYIHDFDIAGYVRSGDLKSSFVEIGKMDMAVFRDNRKEFHHVNKPEFQDIIYNYRGNIKIDSAALIRGNISYTEHTFEANESGFISFNEIGARLYKITNDTIYRTDTAFFRIECNALLMGKGKISVLLDARIFDSKNTFSLNGTLYAIDARELNPMLEKRAFIYVTSGMIQEMSFSFTADNKKALGTMTMLYKGLDLAIKNKRTDDTTAFRERLVSWLVNRNVIDSNPLTDEEIRVGIIDFDRDPERFLLNYCSRAILSGIRSSIQRNSMK